MVLTPFLTAIASYILALDVLYVSAGVIAQLMFAAAPLLSACFRYVRKPGLSNSIIYRLSIFWL